MRYYMTLRGRLTTITVSDELSEYLVVKLGCNSVKTPSAKRMAQAWINKLAWESEKKVPNKNVSQWVQGRILDLIVDPSVQARRMQILKERENPTKGVSSAAKASLWENLRIIDELRKRPRARSR